jgi:hypothetical protein
MDAEQLADLRPKVFDLRRRVLCHMASAIRDRDPQTLWSRCLEEVTQCLDDVAAEFLLRMDLRYGGYSARSAPLGDGKLRRGAACGGLTTLFELIGHVEKELLIGTLAKTRDALEDAIGLDHLQRPRMVTELHRPDRFPTLPSISANPYLDLVAAGKGDQTRRALDLFAIKDAEEPVFWASFRDRAEKALSSQFKTLVGVRVKQRFRPVLEPLLQQYADDVEGRLHRGELLGGPSPSQRVFRKKGKSWTIIFDGEVAGMAHSVGMSHIALLLGSPGKRMLARDLRAAQLAAGVHPDSALRRAPKKNDLSGDPERKEVVPVSTGEEKDNDENGGGHLSSMSSNAGDVLDKETWTRYLTEIRRLAKQLDVAEKAGMTRKADDIRESIDFIRKELDRAFTQDGHPRKMSTEEKKAGDTVRAAIKRILKDLRETHPALWRHLQPPNLTIGPFFFQYAPDPPVEWEF